MIYQIQINQETTSAFLNGKLAATFETDTFLTNVISSKEFKIFERNPEKTKFEIRKLEFNLYKL